MQPIVSNLAALTVAMLFYLWRTHYQAQQQRRRLLCRRVAYLLWAVAENIKNDDTPLPDTCIIPLYPPEAAR